MDYQLPSLNFDFMGKDRSVGQESVSMEPALLLCILFTLPDDSWKKAYINRASEIVIGTSSPRQKYPPGYSHPPEHRMIPCGQERCELNRERSSCLLWLEKGIQSNGHKTRKIMHKKYLETSSYWINISKKTQTKHFYYSSFQISLYKYFQNIFLHSYFIIPV